jgi:hypothetical protein
LHSVDIDFSFSMMSATALSMPRFISIGLTPATTALQTFVEDRFGHDGRGGGSVTGIVGSLAGDFLDHLGAHVFELVASSISRATVTPSLVTVGEPKLFCDDHVAALGTEVI